MAWFRRSRDTLSGAPGAAASANYTLGGIEIGSPWARASSHATGNGGGFFTLANKGLVPDRLIAASSPAAERVEIHAIKVEGGDLRMRQRENGLALPPGTTLTLKPRGYHLLLIGLKTPLEQGSRAAVTLTFENAGSIDIELVAAAPGPVGQKAF
ncbi:MAG: copper chaperone PCu(A)C [Rhodospirillales bacterium]|nr:copper chaperone PCu(A)C [Rhodospirillales bacterium]